MAPAGVALLLGLDAALLLLDLPAPLHASHLGDVHGVLLVLGFLGTVIALERAVALARPLGYLAPALTGLGGLALLGPAPRTVGGPLLAAGTAGMLLVYRSLWRRQPASALLAEMAGALSALVAALLWWRGLEAPTLIPWFAGFAVLTIAGERLELARLGGPGVVAERWLLALVTGVLGGQVAVLLWPAAGSAVLGVALLALVGWLVTFDAARRLVHTSGLPRFSAAAILTGYVWLVVAGGIWLLVGHVTEGPAYDALVHAVFLGFALSMIFAHAPVIMPAVLRRPLPYHPAMWAPLVLLQVSLLIRVVGGDARHSTFAWQLGGALNVVAVLLFLAVTVWSGVRARQPSAGPPGPPEPVSPEPVSPDRPKVPVGRP